MSVEELNKFPRSIGDQDPTRALTEMQQIFVNAVARDNMNKVAAARQAGFKDPNVMACTLMHNAKIQAAIAKERALYAEASKMTKQKVMDGLLEAIDLARMKAEPVAMIMGWREVGKMCGFYEPQKTELKVSFKGQILLQKINTMSDAELLALAEDDPTIIEGEFNVEPNTVI